MKRLSLPLILAAALLVSACGSSGDKSNGDGGTTAAATQSTPTVNPAPKGCKTVPFPEPATAQAAALKLHLKASKKTLVTLNTSCGKIVIELNVKQDPKIANWFGSLVKQGFYDGLAFHRVVKGFVIQGGDPAGDGSGGPDGTIVEKPPSNQKYTKGIVAMAKTATDPAGTAGSQFFIVTGDDAGLPAEYAVAGKVVSGQDVADRISNIPTENGSGDGPPVNPVIIEKGTISANQ